MANMSRESQNKFRMFYLLTTFRKLKFYWHTNFYFIVSTLKSFVTWEYSFHFKQFPVTNMINLLNQNQ